jgi:type VI protein secretion system component VasF
VSPQFNGEERGQAQGRSGTQPIAVSDDATLSLPPVVDVSRVIKSPVQNEDLAPLFDRQAILDFRGRWDLIQRGFVDDPKDSVHAADELLTQLTQSLAARFSEQRAALEGTAARSGNPNTETLRLMLRQYHAFLDRLLAL